MVKSRFLKVTLSGLLMCLCVFQIFRFTEAAVSMLGEVKCTVFVNFSESFYQAHKTCWDKQDMKSDDKKDNEEKEKPYPFNATIEDFEWDDNCMEHCVYETSGMLGNEGALPDKSITTELFRKGKVSENRNNLIVSAWNDCLEISGKIAKEKNWDKCKVVTHHDYCFNNKMEEVEKTHEIEC